MAVYTKVDTAEIFAFLDAYDSGALISYAGIAEGVENSNYALTTTRGRFVLTLYEKRVAAEDLPFFIGLMSHLAARRLPCPQPVATREGKTLNTLAGHHALLATFLPGQSLTHWDTVICYKVGKALAGLHVAAEDYTGHRTNALGLDGCKILAQKIGDRAYEVAPGLATLIANEITYLSNVWPKSLPTGIIHADLFPDNVLFENDEITGIIDFYFACNDMLAYDLAIALNCWCFEGIEFNQARKKELLDGYNSVRPLGAEEVEAMPILMRGAALRFLLTRLYDWLNPAPGALVRPHDPLEYMRKLQFHRDMS